MLEEEQYLGIMIKSEIETMKSDITKIKNEINGIKTGITDIMFSVNKTNATVDKYIEVHNEFHKTTKERCKQDLLAVVQPKQGIEDVIAKTVYEVIDKENIKFTRKTTTMQKWIQIFLVIAGGILASSLQILIYYLTN